MRIWTLDPKYLDTKGLLAAWREGLLAQKVLKGETKGYTMHPQLARFKTQKDPVGAIAGYLQYIYQEAERRKYKFDRSKIELKTLTGQIQTTNGQLLYEWKLLKGKLKKRDTEKYEELVKIENPQAHPIFNIVKGQVEDWEKINETI
jgi:Pyrimidine dimer DNA glycosylase